MDSTELNMTDEAEGRAGRLKAAFPGAYHEEGALVSFDMGAIKAAMGWVDPVTTRSGIEFHFVSRDVWLTVDTQIGNVVSGWSWRITAEEWETIVANVAHARAVREAVDRERAAALSDPVEPVAPDKEGNG